MALYIDIVKISEDENYAKYKFYTSETNGGIVLISKSDGHVKEITTAPNDEQGHLFERTAWALMRHWRKSEYPDKTCWVS